MRKCNGAKLVASRIFPTIHPTRRCNSHCTTGIMMKMILFLIGILSACLLSVNSFRIRGAPKFFGQSRRDVVDTSVRYERSRLNTIIMSTATDDKISAAPADGETFAFESNVGRVMDIIINSLYSNRDVFIRELVSNAADACDKRRYLSLTKDNIVIDDLKIRVYPNREKNTLTIEDSGIGMNKEDLIRNLGRIAESGTKRFLDNMGKNKDDVNLIGQFGVGFYSGFLVADKLEVITKGSEGNTLRWEAEASSLDKYKITNVDLQETEPISSQTGTRIILHLKEESDQYLDDVALKALIEKYSEFVAYPIELQRLVTEPMSVPDTSKPAEADGTIPMKTVMNKKLDWQVVNTKKPLWLRSPKECEKSDYQEVSGILFTVNKLSLTSSMMQFYRQTFNAYDEPLAHAHFSIEGNVDFKALLYIPSEVPYELSREMFASSARALR